MRDGYREVLTSLLYLDSVVNSPSLAQVIDVKSNARRASEVFEKYLKEYKKSVDNE